MAINLSTAGVQLAYCVETTAGTRPTEDFIRIKGIKRIKEVRPLHLMSLNTKLTSMA